MRARGERWVFLLAATTLACSKPLVLAGARGVHEEPPHESAALAGDAGHDAREAPAGARDAGVDGASPAPLLLTTREALRELAAVASGLDAGSPVLFAVGPEAGRFNQGNPETSAHDHAIDRARCKEGLRGVTLQTEAQRAACHGKPNMVPVYRGADAGAAQACIDVFEYPNEACELPFVWGTPSAADRLCRAEGKRLCTQDEWTLACAGDPGGAPSASTRTETRSILTVCNTNKPHRFGRDGETWAARRRTRRRRGPPARPRPSRPAPFPCAARGSVSTTSTETSPR